MTDHLSLDQLAEQALAKVRRQLLAEPEQLKRILRGFLEQAAEAATQSLREQLNQALWKLAEAEDNCVGWKEKAEAQATLKDHPKGECPTWYDGCNCTVETLLHNIDRAEKAEQQLAQATQERDEAVNSATNWATAARVAEATLRTQRQELETLRAAVEVARALPFCGHIDCAGGQHPASNCLSCEELWNRWEQAKQAACTPTKLIEERSQRQ